MPLSEGADAGRADGKSGIRLLNVCEGTISKLKGSHRIHTESEVVFYGSTPEG
jgi:hypothetical protein